MHNPTTTPAIIKRWLKRIDQDRAWLANHCGVSKSTVDGWLAENAQRAIPAPCLRIISTLMNERMVINPQITLNDYSRIQQAANGENITVNEWIQSAIKKQLEAEQPDASTISLNETPATYKPDASP